MVLRRWTVFWSLLVLAVVVKPTVAQQCVERLSAEQCGKICRPEDNGDPRTCNDWFTTQECCRTNKRADDFVDQQWTCVCEFVKVSGAGIGIIVACVVFSLACIFACIFFFYRITKKNRMTDCEHNKLAIDATRNYLPR
mmetsp:Transcript_9341/g.28136  ORF Transcript_9341/g.28136 Transcript_9341/m.28136 type:complete len:139 (+) Transcript_9341:109-525(+)